MSRRMAWPQHRRWLWIIKSLIFTTTPTLSRRNSIDTPIDHSHPTYHPDHTTLRPIQPRLTRNSKFPRFTTVQQNWSNTTLLIFPRCFKGKSCFPTNTPLNCLKFHALPIFANTASDAPPHQLIISPRSQNFSFSSETFSSLLKSDSHLPKIFCVACLIESHLKVMKSAFYLILKALFVLKIFKFLSRLFSHVGKTAWVEI